MVCAAVRSFNQEWAGLSTSAAALERLRSWSEQESLLAGADDLGQVLSVIRRSPDPVLGFLIGAGQGGDELAVRVVMQAMLGGVVGACRSLPEQETMLSYLWETVVTYPLARRPVRIASNLKLDTVKRARAGNADPGQEEVVDAVEVRSLLTDVADTSGSGAGSEWTASRLIETASELGLVSPATRRILQAAAQADRCSVGVSVAAAMGVSPACGRQRLHHAVVSLRAHRSRLLAAA